MLEDIQARPYPVLIFQQIGGVDIAAGQFAHALVLPLKAEMGQHVFDRVVSHLVPRLIILSGTRFILSPAQASVNSLHDSEI